MPRESYDYLSSETKKTLEGNVKAMAAGWDKSREYIYQILTGEKSDFFPAFHAMYLGACEGGVSTSEWDAKLEYARDRRKANARSIAANIHESLETHHLVVGAFVDAMEDGVLSHAELDELERRAINAKDSDDRLLFAIKLRREEIENGKRGAMPSNGPNNRFSRTTESQDHGLHRRD